MTEQFSADDRVPAPAAHDRRSGADGPPPVSTDAGNDLGQLRAPLGMTTIRWADQQIVTLTKERDRRQARLDEIRAVLADEAYVRGGLKIDNSRAYLDRIRAIVERGAGD